MNIRFQEVTLDNYIDVLQLTVREDQQAFVATTAISLVEAYVYERAGYFVKPLAVYDEDSLIGFTMLLYDDRLAISPGDYLLFRLMIDQRHQQKGYFKQVMTKLVDYVKTEPNGQAEHLWTSYEPENFLGRSCYQKFGFRETGEQHFGEIVALYDLN